MATALVAAVVVVVVVVLFRWRRNATKWKGLPPGLSGWPIFGHMSNLLATTKSGASALEDLVSRSRSSLGEVFTLWLPGAPLVVVADAALAPEALVSKGAAFADRPVARGFRALISDGGRTINAARYGPLWRKLRANLASGILSPASLGHFRRERRWALDRLVHDLVRSSASGEVRPREHVRRAFLRMVVALCFGIGPKDDDDDAALEELMAALQQLLRTGLSQNDNPLTPLLPWKRRQAERIWLRIYAALVPLMRRAQPPSYAATLRDASAVVAADDERHMAVLCSEFLVASIDTTATTLEWALAHITRLPDVQQRLHRELAAAYADDDEKEEADEEELIRQGKLQYLEAILKETLRRNPPIRFVVNHAVTEETELAGYRFPAQTRVNFDVHGMGMNPAVWEAPQEFRPQRFMRGDGGAKTGWDEDKDKDNDDAASSQKKRLLRMMPFGVGRRVCPGTALAMLHMNLSLSRLVRAFQWKQVSPIDMTESLLFTTQMKHPLRAFITQR